MQGRSPEIQVQSQEMVWFVDDRCPPQRTPHSLRFSVSPQLSTGKEQNSVEREEEEEEEEEEVRKRKAGSTYFAIFFEGHHGHNTLLPRAMHKKDAINEHGDQLMLFVGHVQLKDDAKVLSQCR